MAGWIKTALGTEVGLGPGHIAIYGNPASLSKNGGGPPPQFSVHFYCGQTVGCIKMPLSIELGRPQPRRLSVRWGPALLPRKGAEPPDFGPILLRPNGWMNQDATWYGGRPQPRRLCVGWGSNPPQIGGGAPQFSAHVHCGQTAAWIKMPLGVKVGLDPGHIVVDGDPAPLCKKGAESPLNFRPISIVAKRLDGSRCHLVRM